MRFAAARENFSGGGLVEGSMLAAEAMQVQRELPTELGEARTRWFSDRGSVVEDGDERLVFVGGSLIGKFEVGDSPARNVLLVNLLANESQHIGRLARAFGVGESTLYSIRARYEREGLEAIVRVNKPPIYKPKLNARQRRNIEAMFDRGRSVADVLEHVEKKYGVKRTTVYAIRRAWRARRVAADAAVQSADEVSSGAVQCELEAPMEQDIANGPMLEADGGETEDAVDETVPGAAEEDVVVEESVPVPTRERIREAPLDEGTTQHVQHAGTWIMLAGLAGLGLYEVVAAVTKANRASARGLRVALDAFVASLSIGERCVEGTRRLATATASVLLRASAAPSAPWVRATLARVSSGAAAVQDAMTKIYLSAAAAAGGPAIFYIDNHMRPYTGKQTLRKGWRMQDKRALPGASDYYVHDVDGRPVMRVTEPGHGSLTDFLLPIAKMLRAALGLGSQIVLAFDRGGAFPEAMSELRDAGVHFVTYERKPYAMLASTLFEPEHVVTLGDKTYTLYENRLANLGKGRGRVRRIAVLTPDGRQINLLAVSDLPAKQLLAIMLGRWEQENGFKHGNERWGINQLDGRVVTEYAPDTVIPNPARTRLDAALRIAKRREGEARNALARSSPADDTKRAKLEALLEDALRDQADLLAQRPAVPKRLEVQHSELSRDLVHHTPEYKGLLDAIRIACANVESELAAKLGPILPRPREAKKVLANLFAAPGTIRVSRRTIRITLAPAATTTETTALARFLELLDDHDLVLPGDDHARKLRLRLSK